MRRSIRKLGALAPYFADLGRIAFAVPFAIPFAIACALAVPAAAGTQRTVPVGGLEPRIVNGQLETGYPTVGALLNGGGPDEAGAWCSGTLIGCETFLTAAHCVEGYGPSSFQVFLPSSGIHSVTRIAMHPGFDFPAGDVAVLELGSRVNGIAPTPIDLVGPPAFGSSGTIVGYGRSGGANDDYGLKRAGDVTTASCANIPAPGSDTTSVCWRFAAPIGSPGTDSNTCNADSGGPLLVDFGAGDIVAGITSGGTSASCLPTDDSYDANVYTYRAFIQAQGGADLANTACGNLPQVGSPGVRLQAATDSLDSSTAGASHVFEVAPGTAALRVAMNAIDDGSSDFDLYVRAGSAPTQVAYDCARAGSNQFAVCSFSAPAAGSWHVLVKRYSGAGRYQLTVTTFATDCAAPQSTGLPCDDEDPCTAGDACAAGRCTGAPAADATACDDGDPCSQPDLCEAGRCRSHAPALGCLAPARPRASLLRLLDSPLDASDRLVWKWRPGAATTLVGVGDPTADTSYALCLYDDVRGAPERKMRLTMPAGSDWATTATGFRYQASTLPAGASLALTLQPGGGVGAPILVDGSGGVLGVPALPLAQQSRVRMQLLNGQACWEAAYSTSVRNLSDRFRARSD